MVKWVVGFALGGAALCVAQAPVTPDEASYVRWLEERSMLAKAAGYARDVSGRGDQWRHAYGEPRPRDAVRAASVWLLDYPGSVITRPGANVFTTWGDPQFWDALRDLGIDLLHTGPLNRAGGVRGREYTPTNDGWFDPIALDFDPLFGTEEQYRAMVRVAAERGGAIAGDLVPLHTGTGPDFRLAQRAYKDYPGLYTMVEIRREDWGLLPPVKTVWDGVPVPREAVTELARKGYLPGWINSNDADNEAKSWSGWSASGEVVGFDGKSRRWVYLHYFKPTQPALNWLDPSFAAQRAVTGDLNRLVHGYGAKVVRLDAVPFIGIEPKPGDAETLHFKHPLSVTGTDTLAMMARKLGGWTFHELNVPLVDLKQFTAHGPDLSYDFFTRAQVLHALLTGDAGPLRLAHRMLLEAGVQPVSLVHDLQNHDEITYQLVELDHRKDKPLAVGRDKPTGKQLKERMLAEMREKVAASPRNKLYRPERDGIATTFAGYVAAAVGVREPERATRDDVERIRRGHLLLAAANALQPGVFGLSSWDLVGALPITEESVKDRIQGGDYRWVNRGGIDLLGANKDAKTSAYGLVRAISLYGPLPDQLKDPASFVARLKAMLAARKRYGFAEGTLAAVPEPKHPAVTLLVIKLPKGVAVSAFNFGTEPVEETVDLAGHVSAGQTAKDILAGADAGKVSDDAKLTIRLGPVTGTAFVVAP